MTLYFTCGGICAGRVLLSSATRVLMQTHAHTHNAAQLPPNRTTTTPHLSRYLIHHVTKHQKHVYSTRHALTRTPSPQQRTHPLPPRSNLYTTIHITPHLRKRTCNALARLTSQQAKSPPALNARTISTAATAAALPSRWDPPSHASAGVGPPVCASLLRAFHCTGGREAAAAIQGTGGCLGQRCVAGVRSPLARRGCRESVLHVNMVMGLASLRLWLVVGGI